MAVTKFLCSYLYDGHRYDFHLEATSHEDAERRLAAIGRPGARVDGEHIASGTLKETVQ